MKLLSAAQRGRGRGPSRQRWEGEVVPAQVNAIDHGAEREDTMAEEPAYKRALREYADAAPDASHAALLETELYGASDRAAAILYGTLTENALVGLVAKQMRPDLDASTRSELFDTFERKIALAYALRLIGPLSRRDLDLIRLIRNAFAHCRRPIDFKLREVMDACAALEFPDFPKATVPPSAVGLSLEEAIEAEGKAPLPDKTDARVRYVMACHNLYYRMTVAAMAPGGVAKELFGPDPRP